MSCSYWGTDYNQANLQRDICEHSRVVTKLNALSSAYNTLVADAQDLFNQASILQSESQMIMQMMPSQKQMSIAKSLDADKLSKLAQAKMEEAALIADDGTMHTFERTAVEGVPIMTGCYLYQLGVCVAPKFTLYFQLMYGGTVNQNFKDAIEHVDMLADRIANYSSWSFGFSYGGSGFTLTADTFITLGQLALKVARDINLISDKVYSDITTSKFFGLALQIGSQIVGSYGIKALGLVKTDLGYMSEKTAKEMFTSDVRDVFRTINTLQAALYLGKAIATGFDKYEKQEEIENKQDAVAEIKKRQSYLRSKHENNNRFMPLDNMMKVAETKHNRIGHYRVFNTI